MIPINPSSIQVKDPSIQEALNRLILEINQRLNELENTVKRIGQGGNP